MTQETLKRLCNTFEGETQDMRLRILEKYITELNDSGYYFEEIERFMVPGVVGYERRVLREAQGEHQFTDWALRSRGKLS